MRRPWVSRRAHDRLIDQYAALGAELVTASRTIEAKDREIRNVMQAFNEIAAEMRRDGDRHEREAIRAETRYADLMVSYRMLRLQGHTPAPEPVAVVPEKPDPILVAINSVARDAKTRAAAIRQAQIDKDAGLTPVEIIQRIQRGNRPAEIT